MLVSAKKSYEGLERLIRLFTRMIFLGLAILLGGTIVGILIGGSPGAALIAGSCGTGALMSIIGVRERARGRSLLGRLKGGNPD